jgi:RimJ/RimL family protein N-acetyltransferase
VARERPRATPSLDVDKPWGRPYEVGYLVRTNEWGEGVATEALGLIADWLVEDARATKIMLFTHLDNGGSQRVAEKAGFVRDGIEHHYAQFKDGLTDAIRFVRTSPAALGGAGAVPAR